MKRIFLVFAVLIVIAYFDQQEGDITPRRPDPTPGAKVLPVPSTNDPVYVIEADKPCAGTCRGSAFAIDLDGHYVTARHVLTGCRSIEVLTDANRRLPVRELRHHSFADLSLLTVQPAADHRLPVNVEKLKQGQDGYHFGFPAGNPGEVHGKMLGRAWTRRGGSGGVAAPVVAWAEVRRSLVPEGSLGGLSGGAVLDSEGELVGVTILEAPRRGRVISAAPESLNEVLNAIGVRAGGSPSSDSEQLITAQSFPKVGRALRESDSVVRVYCWA